MNKPTKIEPRYVTAHGRHIRVIDLVMPGQPAPRARRGVEWVKLPMFWIKKLRGQSPRTYELAHLLLELGFRHHGHTFKLSNEAVCVLKLDRHTKSRLLFRLERLGLILVRREGKAAPLITVKTKG